MIDLVAALALRQVRPPERARDGRENPPASPASSTITSAAPQEPGPPPEQPTEGRAWPEPFEQALRLLWAELAWHRLQASTNERDYDHVEDPTQPS